MKTLIISLSKISKAFLKCNIAGLEIDIFSPSSKIDGFNCFNSYNNLQENYDVVFLGCKPQHLSDVAKNLPKSVYGSKTIFISVLAGVRTSTIQSKFGVRKVVRVMPSLAFEFGNSFLACFGSNVSSEEMEKITNLFLPNKVIQCQNEQEIDEFTAIYGSGIGFVFQIMEEFLQASTGFMNGSNHYELILNLFENATLLAKKEGIGFQECASRIASRGGTTEAGLRILKNSEIQKVFFQAMEEALKRAKTLAHELEK